MRRAAIVTSLLMTAGLALPLMPSVEAELNGCFGTYDPVLRTCTGIWGHMTYDHVTNDGGRLVAVCQGVYYYDYKRCEWEPAVEDFAVAAGNGEVRTPRPPVRLPEGLVPFERVPSVDCHVGEHQTACALGEEQRVLPVGVPAPCVPGGDASCGANVVEAGGFYVALDAAREDGRKSIYVYEESNGVDGLQRDDEVSRWEEGDPDTLVSSGTAPSPADASAPEAPPVLSALPGTESAAALAWTAPISGSPTVGYNVYRGDCPSCATLLASVPPSLVDGVAVYLDTSVQPNRTYFYEVAAVSASGEGLRSNQAQVTIQSTPGPDPYLWVLGGDGTATLRWVLPPHVSYPVNGFVVYRAEFSGDWWTKTAIHTMSVSPQTRIATYTDTGLDNGKMYFYQVLVKSGSITHHASNQASAMVRGNAETVLLSWHEWRGPSVMTTPGLTCGPLSFSPAGATWYISIGCNIHTQLVSGAKCENGFVAAGVDPRSPWGELTGEIVCGGGASTIHAACTTEAWGAPCSKSAWGTSIGNSLECYGRLDRATSWGPQPTFFFVECSNDP